MRWIDVIEGSDFPEDLKCAFGNSKIWNLDINDDLKIYCASIYPAKNDKTIKNRHYYGCNGCWSIVIKVYCHLQLLLGRMGTSMSYTFFQYSQELMGEPQPQSTSIYPIFHKQTGHHIVGIFRLLLSSS